MDLVYSGELLLNLQELFSDQPGLSCPEEADLLLFTHHYPARCFGMNMPKSRDIQAKFHCRRQSGMNFG